MFADDLTFMSNSMEKLGEKFLKWKKVFKSKGLKVNLGETAVMVNGLKGETLKTKIDPCAKSGRMVIAVLCAKCSKLVRGRCAKIK